MNVELLPAGEPDLSPLRDARGRMQATLAEMDTHLSYYEKARRLAEAERADLERTVKAAIARYSAISRPMPSQSELDELYRTSVMVAAFAHYRADNVARVPFRVLDDEDRPPPEGHPLRRLFARRFADALRRTELALQYRGGSLLLKRRSLKGDWVGVRWLNPNLWRPDLQAEGLAGFFVYHGGYTYERPPDQYIDAGDALYLHEMDFDSDFEGVGWVERAFSAAASEEEISLTILSFMRNRAVPLLIITPAEKGGINSGVSAAEKAALNEFADNLQASTQGSANAGRTVLDPFRWEIHETTIRFDQAAMPELYKQVRETISLASSVPESLVLSGASNYAEQYGQKQGWLEDWLIPHVEWYADWITEDVQREFGAQWRVAPDLEAINRRLAALNVERVNAQVQSGYLTLYDAQRETGLKPDEHLKGIYVIGGQPVRAEDVGQPRYPWLETPAGANGALGTGGILGADNEGSLPPRPPLPGKRAWNKRAWNTRGFPGKSGVGFGFWAPVYDEALSRLRDRLEPYWAGPGVEWTPATWHISLCYARDPAPPAVVERFAQAAPPYLPPAFFVEVAGFEVWDTPDGTCLVALIRPSGELLHLQRALRGLFWEAGLPVSEHSEPEDYRPHVTLAYAPAGARGGPKDVELPDAPEGAVLLVDQVALVTPEASSSRTWRLPLERPQPAGDVDGAALKAAFNKLDAWGRRDAKSAAYVFESPEVPPDTQAVVRFWLEAAPMEKRAIAFDEGRAHVVQWHGQAAPGSNGHGKAWSDTEAGYRAALTDLVTKAFQATGDVPVLSRDEFGSLGRAEIRAHLTQAYLDGMREAGAQIGGAGGLSADAAREIKAFADQEARYWTRFANEVYKDALPQRAFVTHLARAAADLEQTCAETGDERACALARERAEAAETAFAQFQTKQRQFLYRVGLWVTKGLGGAFEMGKLAADDEKLLIWVYGDTIRHCATCRAAEGQVHRARDWRQANLRPKGHNLECHGYLCDCGLVPAPLGAQETGDLSTIPLFG